MTDVSALLALADRLDSAGAAIEKAAEQVLKKGMVNVKNDARKRVSGNSSWRHLASTIEFQPIPNGYQIGYARRGQGKLGHIAEFGSARKAAHPALLPAFDAELEAIPGYLTKAIAQAWRRA